MATCAATWADNGSGRVFPRHAVFQPLSSPLFSARCDVRVPIRLFANRARERQRALPIPEGPWDVVVGKNPTVAMSAIHPMPERKNCVLSHPLRGDKRLAKRLRFCHCLPNAGTHLRFSVEASYRLSRERHSIPLSFFHLFDLCIFAVSSCISSSTSSFISTHDSFAIIRRASMPVQCLRVSHGGQSHSGML